VGMDNRLSSPELHRAFIEVLMQAGVNVADVGVTTTPALYFAVAHLDFDGGVNITGSHKPAGLQRHQAHRCWRRPINAGGNPGAPGTDPA